MKAKILYLTMAAASMSHSLFAATTENPTEFDFAKINSTIKAAMDQNVVTSSLISKFTYEFEPSATDPQKDQYAIKMRVDGKEPWSDKTFSSTTTLLMKHDPSGVKGVTDLTMKMDISIDALAFVRHHALKSMACTAAESAMGVLRVALTEDCKVAPKLANVQSFDELDQIMREHIENAKLALSNYHTDLSRALNAVENDVTKKSLELQIAETEHYVKSVSEAKLERTSDGVRLKIGHFSILGLAQVKNFEADFSSTRVLLQCDSSLALGGVIYSAAKPELLQLFKDLENGEEYTKPLIQLETKFWLRLFENHLSPKNQ